MRERFEGRDLVEGGVIGFTIKMVERDNSWFSNFEKRGFLKSI